MREIAVHFLLAVSSVGGFSIPSSMLSQTAQSSVAVSTLRVRPSSMGLFDDVSRAVKHLPIQQMIDQRVAKVSHILMKPGGPMSIDEARAQFEEWKAEIDGDPDKFAEVAKRVSDDETTREKGGDLGYCTRVQQLPPQIDDVVFVKDPMPGVYGPIASVQGLHLIYLFSCGEPMGRTEALFDPPNSLKAKLPGQSKQD